MSSKTRSGDVVFLFFVFFLLEEGLTIVRANMDGVTVIIFCLVGWKILVVQSYMQT